MRRRQIFVDTVTGEAVVLPVTPSSYAWENAINVEQVTIDQLGDLNFPGKKKLDHRTVECLLPARLQPFCEPEARPEPFWYVEWFQKRCQGGVVLRYIVSGTPLNAAVLIQAVEYGEDDGSNDLTVKLTLRQYQQAEVVATATGNAQTPAESRPTDGAVSSPVRYTVQAGDTLSSIARKFYGDANLYARLAGQNGIKNPNLIHPGEVLTIPPAGELPAAASLPRSAMVAKATTTAYDGDAKRWRVQLAKEEAMA